MRRTSTGLAALVAAACSMLVPATAAADSPVYLNPSYTPMERAADLVSRMTLDEKAQELASNYAIAIPRLGVQQYAWWNEDQHGVSLLFGNADCGQSRGCVGRGQAPHATSFPTNFAAAMSWDPSLSYEAATAISDEARGFLDKSRFGNAPNNLGPSASDYGSLSFFAPNINLDRDPRWGRTNEAFGEDPYLVSQMADAYVEGAQGETMAGTPLTPYLKTIAVAKHYALNSQESDRTSGSSDTTDANLRDYYTKQFASVIETAHVAGLMSSYNAINGTPSPVDTYTLDQLARRTYGFDGYIASDCQAITAVYSDPFLAGSGAHDWAPPGWTAYSVGGTAVYWTNDTTGQRVSASEGAQALALRAGTAVNCLGPESSAQGIEDAIAAGVLSEGVLDTALVHMFAVRIETGEFDPPSMVPWTAITSAAIESPAHTALARAVAGADLVLLKNDRAGARPLLPADPRALQQIVIVGDLAGKVTLGGYSGKPDVHVDAVQGIRRALAAARSKATVRYDACHTSTTATGPAQCSARTRAAIRRADLVVVFAGTDLAVATEGRDAASIAMPGNYDSLIDAVAAAGNRRMVLAIQAAMPVTLAGVQQHFPAIVFSGYNGEEQGDALADVLFGRVDPAGRLDFTWYRDDSQLPPIADYGLTPAQTGGLGRTYEYFTGTPTYPFGYGLSYTRFRFSSVAASPAVLDANGSVTETFTVTNTGSRPGAAVPQLYAAPQFASSTVALPVRQLVGFERTRVLAPGESQQLSITVAASALERWNEAALREVVPDGPWRLELSTAAGQPVAEATVQVTGAVAPRVAYVTVEPSQVELGVGQSLDLTGRNPWIAPDTAGALEQPHQAADGIVEAVDDTGSFVDLTAADVGYRTSDPTVATVSSAGMVQAVGPGVTTISVTVNGVTGSAPIVVH